MASENTISKVEIGGTNYDLVASNGVYYIEGTGSTAGTWLGSHPDITAYYPGLMVLYKIPVAGASTTKLNINSLGAVTVVRNVTTAISTAYAVKALVLLTYTLDGTTAYWKVADYDSNTKNSAGSADTDQKIFLIGATSQKSSTTTYSQAEVFADAGGILNAEKLVLNTTGTPAISLKRSSNNYLQVPTEASFCVCPNNSVTLADSALVVAAEGVYPGATNTFSLGKSSAKWSTVYATTFNGSGASLTNLPAGQLTGTIDAARLPTASSTLGGVKTTSTVTSTSGLTACPIINGVVYYKDTNTHAVSSVNGQTGDVTLKFIYGNANYTLRLNDNATDRTGALAVKDASNKNVWILTNTTTAGVLQYQWYDSNGSWVNQANLLHTKNYTDYCAPASHTHNYLPLTGGTVSGEVNSSANVTASNAAFRNIKAVPSTTEIVAGTTAIPTGEIWVRYE